MALSDLAVFSEFVYSAQTEVLTQQVELFNTASRGTIILRTADHVGDYSETAFWALINGIVRRRNAYGSGAVTPVDLSHLVDTMVKVAAGTPPINLPPGQFEWIQRNPEEGGAVVGQQLARATMADMLNTAILATVAALSGVAAVVKDSTGATANAGVFNGAQALFGDTYQQIQCWIMHSKPLFDIFGAAFTNAEGLFSFGDVNVRTDPFGRTFVVSDSPALVNTTPNPDQYYTLGLVSGAVQVHQQSDFTDNFQTINGDENILRNYQAEWSYELGIKGFAWDKTNGGKSPNDAALGTSTNWDRYATSHKDLAGILLKTQ